eukprot:scaffold442_cov268-Pinguiococcus_pyrenoidosus.AAC.64
MLRSEGRLDRVQRPRPHEGLGNPNFLRHDVNLFPQRRPKHRRIVRVDTEAGPRSYDSPQRVLRPVKSFRRFPRPATSLVGARRTDLEVDFGVDHALHDVWAAASLVAVSDASRPVVTHSQLDMLAEVDFSCVKRYVQAELLRNLEGFAVSVMRLG